MTKGKTLKTRMMAATGLVLTLVFLFAGCVFAADVAQPTLTADAVYARGNELFQNGKFSDAIQEYRTVLSQFPDQTEVCAKAKMSIGKAYYEMKDVEKAHYALRETTRDYYESVPHITVWAQLYLADMYQKEMRYPAAVIAYEELVSDYKNQTELCIASLTNLGKTQRMRGKIAEALAAYQRIVDEFPVSSRVVSDAMFARADICQENGYHDAAMAELKKLMEMYERDRHVQVTAKLRMARCLQETNRAAAVQIARELSKSAIVLGSSDLISELLVYHRQDLPDGEWQGMAQRYVELMATSPHVERAKFAPLEVTYYFAGDIERALVLAEEFMGKYPDHSLAAEAAYLRAHCLLESGDTDGAVDALEALVTKCHDTSGVPVSHIQSALQRLACLLAEQGHSEDALRKLAMIRFGSPEVQASVSNQAGQILMRARRWKEAIAFFAQALAVASVSSDSRYRGLYNMSLCYYHLHDWQTARELMQEIIDSSPSTVWGRRARGALHLWRLRDADTADSDLARSERTE